MPHQKPPACAGCPLEPLGTSFSKPEGLNSFRVALIGEALGDNEAKDGLPFRPYAQAGAVLERAINHKWSRQQFVVWNVCACRPPDNRLEHTEYETAAIEHCQVHFRRVIEQYQPKAIVALGNIPLRTLTGYCGKKRQITNVRGFVLDNIRYPGIPVISTYHPAYIARDKSNLFPVLGWDIGHAIQIANKPWSRPRMKYLDFPSVPEAESWVRELKEHVAAGHSPYLTFDIETVESLEGFSEDEVQALDDGRRVQVTKVKEEFEDAPDYTTEGLEEEEVVESQVQAVTRITQIQFSYRPMEAIVLPFSSEYFKLICEVMALEIPKFSWNGDLFDLPLLRGAGVTVNGDQHDLMNVHHFTYPDLPRGLQWVTSLWIPTAEPWKHTSSSDPGAYGAADVCYPGWFGPKLLQRMKDLGIYDSYDKHIRRLRLVLNRQSARGIPINDQRRVEFGQEIDVERAGVDREIQEMVPQEVRGVEPRNGYVNPKIAQKLMEKEGQGLEAGEEWVEREFDVQPKKSRRKEVGTGQRVDRVVEGDQESRDSTGESDSNSSRTGEMVFNGADREVCGGGDGTIRETRWCRLQPFLPNSSQQLLRYITHRHEEEVKAKIEKYAKGRSWIDLSPDDQAAFTAKAERNVKYKIPLDLKKGTPTTAKGELKKLGRDTGDLFFDKVIQHRELGKMRSVYVDGWKPAADGCIHSVFTYGPATGQLSSKNPNCQNGPMPKGDDPRYKKLATSFQGMIEAKPGYKLVCIDWRAFHVLTTGFEAQCADYMRLARLDMHSFVAGHFLKLPGRDNWFSLPDDELREVLKWIKKNHKPVRDRKAKPCILGWGFGMKPFKLWKLNEDFMTRQEAFAIDDTMRGLFPKVPAWQDSVVDSVTPAKPYLFSRYCYIRWFYSAKYWKRIKDGAVPTKKGRCKISQNGMWQEEFGTDAEAAKAFFPSNDAHGMRRDVQVWMGETVDETSGLTLDEKYGLCNDLHDELWMHCPDKWVDEAAYAVASKMRAPNPVLVSGLTPGGLWCDVEVTVGRSRAEMEEVRI